MTNKQLCRAIQSIGKRCFENCYEIAKKRGDSLTNEDLIKHDPALEGTTESGLNTRRSCIKRIFRSGREKEALAKARKRRGR